MAVVGPGLLELLDKARGMEPTRTCAWYPKRPSSTDKSLLPGYGGVSGRLPTMENMVWLHLHKGHGPAGSLQLAVVVSDMHPLCPQGLDLYVALPG